MTTTENIRLILGKLEHHYGSRHGWWPAETPYEMMTGAILVQNTNWKNAEKALGGLSTPLNPERLRKLPTEEIAELIRPSGYYNQKAMKLKNLYNWLELYNDSIEDLKNRSGESLREELLAIKGIGRETADVILVYALDKPFFVIDAYTRRIFSRWGIDVPGDYDKFRIMFEKAVPPSAREYGHLHGLIVDHAQTFCLKKPRCSGCPLEDSCNKAD